MMELKNLRENNLVGLMEDEVELQVVLFSFGFKYGSPIDCNIILDVRFLPNPYWVADLRLKTGKDAAVADFVLESYEGALFMEHLNTMLRFLIDTNLAAGKDILRVGIGCTGGHHRSVAVVETLASSLDGQSVRLTQFHRDLGKDTKALS